jgi:hypothetical protein
LNRKIPSTDKPSPLGYDNNAEFIPDSLEQVSDSVEYIRFRGMQDQTFEQAITRGERATK